LEYLSNKLREDVHFVPYLENVHKSVARVVLLENTRMDARDEAKDEAYAREIINAVKPDIYILDGFSVAHRDQASVTWPARIMKEQGKLAVAGALLQKEYEFLVGKVIQNPARPFLVFLGGAKMDTKMPTLKALLPNVDRIVLGGGMTFPFLLEQRLNVSQIDPFGGKEGREEELDKERAMARSILESPYAHKVILPSLMVGPDHKVLNFLKDKLPSGAYPMKDTQILDIFPQLVSAGYRTIFFNGAFGAFEEKLGGYAEGTNQVFRFMNEQTAKGSLTIPGGGDTMKALKELRKSEKMDFGFETSGGGASGDLLALGFDGKAEELPGFACLTDK
jgi:phosphoglycerate kinase